MKVSPKVRRGLFFGCVCAVFGAATWALIALFTSQQIAILSLTGFLYWGPVGFVIGLFNPARRSNSDTEQGKGRRTVLGILGRFIYRTVIGGLAGFLVAGLIELLMVVLAMVTHGDVVAALDATHHSQVGFLILCGLNAAVIGAQVSGIFFAWIWAVAEIATAVWASAFGALIGALGGIIPPLVTTIDIPALNGALLAGIFGGILASVLAGFLLVKRRRITR